MIRLENAIKDVLMSSIIKYHCPIRHELFFVLESRIIGVTFEPFLSLHRPSWPSILNSHVNIFGCSSCKQCAWKLLSRLSLQVIMCIQCKYLAKARWMCEMNGSLCIYTWSKFYTTRHFMLVCMHRVKIYLSVKLTTSIPFCAIVVRRRASI